MSNVLLGEVICRTCGTTNLPLVNGSKCTTCGNDLFPKSATMSNTQHQQAICPNCGANIRNLQNCEFCGSLLIRLQQQGINIEQSGYKDDSKVFKELVPALKRHLDLQIPPIGETVVHVATDIYYKDINGKMIDCNCGILRNLNSAVDYSEFFPNTDLSKKHLMIVSIFLPDVVSGDDLKLRKFRNLDIYELFTEKISFDANNIKVYEYAIDFGNDAEGAARLISKVMHEVFGIPYEADIECHTNSGDDIVRDRAIMKGIIFGTPIEENVEEKKSTSWWIWLLFLVLLGILILISLFGG
ncbi:MAG: hypothetical protein LBR18_01555 [Tannerella sp.]|jgi:hypothetical protein|nr:hypothetical protein [Tannerella sp.]